jgi:hypothetical protein
MRTGGPVTGFLDRSVQTGLGCPRPHGGNLFTGAHTRASWTANRLQGRSCMKKWLASLVLLLPFMSGQPALGQAVYVDEAGESGKQVLSLPYAFYNETFGFAGAYIHGVVGYPQPQSALLATAMVGSKGSAMVALIGKDLQVPKTERFFSTPSCRSGSSATPTPTSTATPAFRASAPEATTPTRTIS